MVPFLWSYFVCFFSYVLNVVYFEWITHVGLVSVGTMGHGAAPFLAPFRHPVFGMYDHISF